jgi:3',5'-cyclic AMP phosphodiesterase CpdA
MEKKRVILLLLTVNLAVIVSVFAYPSPSVAGSSEAYLFTFAHITDSHLLASESITEKAISWLAENDRISFVVHTGDIVDRPSDEMAWKTAYEYMHRLDNRCDWAVLAGNHDVLSWGGLDSSNYERYFGNSTDQHIIIEDRLLFVLLGWDNFDGSISQERLEWMDSIIEKHERMKTIICLHPHPFGLSLLNILGLPNYEEVWRHIDRHDNVIVTLSGHIHLNWVQVRSNGRRDAWAISTEAMKDKGYIRLFSVYEDRIEVSAYSPWTNQTYSGTLDRFTVTLNNDDTDGDRDLWGNSLDPMPTHPLVPNGILASLTMTIAFLVYWIRGSRTSRF